LFIVISAFQTQSYSILLHFRLSKYFLIIRDENVTFIIEVRRGMKMLFEKYMISKMTNEHVGSMSIIECVIYFQRNWIRWTSPLPLHLRVQLIRKSSILDNIFPKKVHFDLYVNRLVCEYIR